MQVDKPLFCFQSMNLTEEPKIMQTNAQKTCFQFAECSLFSAKRIFLLVLSGKYLPYKLAVRVLIIYIYNGPKAPFFPSSDVVLLSVTCGVVGKHHWCEC